MPSTQEICNHLKVWGIFKIISSLEELLMEQRLSPLYESIKLFFPHFQQFKEKDLRSEKTGDARFDAWGRMRLWG